MKQNILIRLEWLIVAVPILGFLLNLITYFPGFLSPDSIDQFTQATTHNYSDWHPPIMSGLWSLLLYIHCSGAPMFILQLICYWLSCYLFTKISKKHFPKAVYLTMLLFFMPFLQNFVGNVWKDVSLAYVWLLSLSIMLTCYFDKRKLSRWESFFCFILLAYGSWIRYNAIAGVIPLLALWSYLSFFVPDTKVKYLKLLRYTLTAALAVLGLQAGITKWILKPGKTYPEYKLFVHDLTGIYKETGKLYFPNFIVTHPGFDSLYIKQKYKYSTFDNIWWNNDGKTILPNVNDSQMAVLQKQWFLAILKNPLVYLKNRGAGFFQFLRLNNSGSSLETTYMYIHPNSFGLEFKPNALTRLFKRFLEEQRPLLYFKPWFWLLLNFIFFAVSRLTLFREAKPVLTSLLYSSLFYIVLQFVVFQADTEFRYFYWNCISVSISGLIFIWYYLKKRVAS